MPGRSSQVEADSRPRIPFWYTLPALERIVQSIDWAAKGVEALDLRLYINLRELLDWRNAISSARS